MGESATAFRSSILDDIDRSYLVITGITFSFRICILFVNPLKAERCVVPMESR